MAHSVTKSALKSTNSPSRIRKVYFEEDKLFKNLTGKTDTYYHAPPYWSPSLISECITSLDKRDYSKELHSSFTKDHGLSIEEIVCDEIDDILPKTDFTYARSASYSPNHLGEKYISPNMSRRRLRGSQASFLSDDEDEFSSYETKNQVIKSHTRAHSQYNQNAESEKKSSTTESHITDSIKKSGKLHVQNIMTSTPLMPHNQRHISANDLYYNDIILRSGSHYSNKKLSRADLAGGLISEVAKPDVVLSSTKRSDVDTVSRRRSARNYMVITETTTTTTTTTTEPGKRRKEIQKNAYVTEDLSEGKLRLDESQTEKGWNNKEYRLKHLYGLDFEEDISDVDDIRETRLPTTNVTDDHSQSGFFSFITTVITTVITTITSTFSEDSNKLIKSSAVSTSQSDSLPGIWFFQSIANLARWFFHGTSNIVIWLLSAVAGFGNGFLQNWTDFASWFLQSWRNFAYWLLHGTKRSSRWLLHSMANISRWLVARSVTFLLWDIEVKQKRRRGCCCCLLPLLFLLPLFLLGGYYTRGVQQNLGTYLSDSGQLLSSSWSYLWFTSGSQQQAPVPKQIPSDPTPFIATHSTSDEVHVKEAVTHQINMTQIYQYIQQTVSNSAATVKDDRPVGLTKEEVEAIVMRLLAGVVSEVSSGLEGKVDTMKSQVQGDVASLQLRIAELESEIKSTVQAHQTLAANLDETRSSFEGTSAGQRAEWLAASKTLESKLLNLTQVVNGLSTQNAAFTALLANCCRNSSDIADIVRAVVISKLSDMSTYEDGPLAGLVLQMSGDFVSKDELDQRLAAVSVEIMDKLKIMMAAVDEKSNTVTEFTTSSIISGINESTVQSIVEEALINFSADRVGMPDFALESAGGSVISVRCSETYYKKTALVSVFGIPLWYTSNSPRTVIQPSVHPGECWAFKGNTGYIVLQLSHPIMPTGFTLEHIPRSLAPKGDIRSAPKQFTVLGLISESDPEGISLGNYTYQDNGKPIQFFSVQSGHPGIFQFIELRILDNHGNKDYTCVYRFRVHGQP